MRISKKAKEQTRKKILYLAEELFLKNGYDKTTTRDIAKKANLATGTMFNYFSTKEELAMALVSDALDSGHEDYKRRRIDNDGLSEELFLLITSELRRLKPYRNFIGPVLESSMSLFVKNKTSETGDAHRIEHLKIIQNIISSKGRVNVPDFIALNLYWSLYLGILAFWSSDESYNQEETLVLIDHSVKVFAQTIKEKPYDKN